MLCLRDPTAGVESRRDREHVILSTEITVLLTTARTLLGQADATKGISPYFSFAIPLNLYFVSVDSDDFEIGTAAVQVYYIAYTNLGFEHGKSFQKVSFEYMDFKDGEEVQLKSGGPIMTVDHSEVWNGKPRVRCVWFVKDEKKADYFSPATLKRVE